MNLPFSIDRDIVICATRATVFRYFTDPERWATWWGAGSRIDPRPGGEVLIVYPGGSTAGGQVIEIQAPERISFTYGYKEPDSRVTITVTDAPGGTRVRLVHELATETLRDQHVAGWRYQMGVFADVVSKEHDADATRTIDRYLAAWSETDATARRAALEASCADDVIYRDKFGFSNGRADLDGHLAAAQVHLPATLARAGDPRVTLGVALVDWTASKDGKVAAKGTSVIELAPDGRIARVTGFWG
jgi:uncharacterized protein YndB with AHSA1/START domain/ketosteroid isomerase-like protein